MHVENTFKFLIIRYGSRDLHAYQYRTIGAQSARDEKELPYPSRSNGCYPGE
jgi:hypothetical protein